MLKTLLMLKHLKIEGVLINFIVDNFSQDEFASLFNGNVLELQFKYNIFNQKNLDMLLKEEVIKRTDEYVDNLIQKSEEQNIKIISYFDDRYPTALRNINKRPLFVYLKGNEKILNAESTIACVGTRNPSKKASDSVENIVSNLVGHGIVIVSGLAKGIDTNAHRACINNKGKTIAVLAHGLDKIYPKENARLAEKILENDGLLLTEYPVDTEIKKDYFVARNRIVSGISNSVIIFEADEKSGTMHTARFAYKQGKKIFCPVNIYDEVDNLSSGVSKLLSTRSAYPFNNANEILNLIFGEKKQKKEIGQSLTPQYLKLNVYDDNEHEFIENHLIEIDRFLLNKLEEMAMNQNLTLQELILNTFRDKVNGDGILDE
ncbi:DNA-processing protein DprA [Cytobacillus praedii]|uniref:DNA-protecting protein DprA n=1 Tax=Cytobacillus praedii TaxID=1742358 RepID=A0A4R1AW76_9BACI|nr:DNA-processing protein DprA [Cytobacillus praedii]TCJ01330.1 DNA-protecting protein DprA [Cytobacillus praedii]